MKLVLKNSRVFKEICPVTLTGGYIPTLGSCKLFTPDEVDSKAMESALWHKVLVIDWMEIDCDRKIIHWSSIKPSTVSKLNNSDTNCQDSPSQPGTNSSSNIPASSTPNESVYIVGECELDDLDQVYMTLGAMLDKLYRNQITDSDLNQALFSLLHSNILPGVKLSKSDISSIELAILEIKDCMARKSNEILQLTGKIDSIKNALRRLRRQFVEDLLKLKPELITSTYSMQFLQCLHEDIIGDIERANDKLSKLQFKINEVKLTSSGSSSDESNGELVNLRQKRRCHDDDRLQLLQGREALHGVLHGSDAALITASMKVVHPRAPTLKKAANSKAKENVNDKQTFYLGTAEHLQMLSTETKRLGIQQLLIASVREALLSCLNALQSGAELAASDVDLMGRQPTDVLRSSRIPTEWLTVDAFVARNLESDESLKTMHATFCNTVSSYCHEVILVHKLKQAGCQKPVNLHHSNSDGITMRAGRRSMPPTVASEHVLTKSLPETRPKTSYVNGKESVSPVQDGRQSHAVVLEVLAGNNSIDFSDLSVTDDDHDAVIILTGQSDIMRPALDQLKVMIHRHIQKTANVIKQSWYEQSQFGYRRIWLSYERHLYDRTIDDVVLMYNECYDSIMQTFVSWLPRLTFADLDIRDEGMQAVLSGRCSDTSFGADVVAESSKVEEDVDVVVPTSSVRVFSRTTWPLEHGVSTFRKSVDEGLEQHELNRYTMDWALVDNPFMSDEDGGDLDDEVMELQSSSLSPQKDDVFSGGDRFAVALAYLSDMLNLRSLLLKVRSLECCLREIDQQVREYRRIFTKKSIGVNTEEILDILSYLLCSCDVNVAASVYPQLMMLADLVPEFMEKGPVAFCLTSFVAAYNSLQDKIVLKKKVLEQVNENCASEITAQR